MGLYRYKRVKLGILAAAMLVVLLSGRAFSQAPGGASAAEPQCWWCPESRDPVYAGRQRPAAEKPAFFSQDPLQILAEAVSSAEAMEKPLSKVVMLAHIAQAQSKAGDREAASRTIAQAFANTGESGGWTQWDYIIKAQADAGDVEGAFKTLTEHNGNEYARARLNLRKARIQAEAGDIKGALKTARDMADPKPGLSGKGTGYKGTALGEIAAVLAKGGDSAEALKLASEISDMNTQAQALVAIADHQLKSGNKKPARESLLRAFDGFIATKNEGSIAYGLPEVAAGLARARDFPKAFRAAERIQLPEHKAYALAGIAKQQALSGDKGAARKTLDQALAAIAQMPTRNEKERAGGPHAQAMPMARVALALAEGGDREAARRAISRATEAAQYFQHCQGGKFDTGALIAKAQFESGDSQAGHAMLQGAFDHLKELRNRFSSCRLEDEAQTLARTQALLGGLNTVLAWADELESPEYKAHVLLGAAEGLLEMRALPAGAKALARAAPKPRAPAKLSMEVAFAEPSGNDILDAEEKGKLAVTVINSGPGAAYAVRLLASQSSPISGLALPRSLEAGVIPPGQKAAKEIALEASETLASGRAGIRIEAREANGFDAEPVLIEFRTLAFQAPRLELAGLSLGGAGVVKAGELMTVAVTVRNAGAGPAQGVAASLVLESPDIFSSGYARVPLGVLRPGESRKAEFEFFVNKRYKEGRNLPVSLAVTETRGKYGLTRPLGLVLGEAAPALKVVSVAGRETPVTPGTEASTAEDVDVPPQVSMPVDPEAYAVVIGIENYRQEGIPSVDFASRDAQAVHAYLTRAMGFDAKNVILLQNGQANKTDLDKYLGKWLRNQVTAKSRVFVYYAGHGAPNPETGEGYLIPYDGDPSYAEETAYPVKRLYESLAGLAAREVTVTLDACFSGQGQRSVMAKGARPLVTVADETGAIGVNMVVLSATGAGQISTSHTEGRHGLLTYFLLKGLRGEADNDHDGQITTAELFAYVAPAVERAARRINVNQVPAISPGLTSLDSRGARVWLKTK